MRRIAPHILVAMLAGMTPIHCYAQGNSTANDFAGEWILPENGTVIRVDRCGESICSAIVKAVAPKLPDNGPRRRMPGILVPLTLKQNGPTSWHGELYDTRGGESYEGTINLIEKNRLTFVRCLIGSMLCETVTFYRVDPPKVPQEQEVAAPYAPKAKPKSAVKRPTHADFEAFLKARDASSTPTLSDQEHQALFRDFLDWRRKQ